MLVAALQKRNINERMWHINMKNALVVRGPDPVRGELRATINSEGAILRDITGRSQRVELDQ